MEKVLRSLLKRGVIPYAIAAVVVLTGLTGVAAATGTLSDGTATTPSPSTATAASNDQLPGYPAAGGGDNIVQVINRADSATKDRGHVQFNQIRGPNVGPKNEAFAYSSCTNCKSLAIAIQVDLYQAGSHNIQPQNLGLAVNFNCNGCLTAAYAIQAVIPVADPTQIPGDVRRQLPVIDQQIRDYQATLSTNPNITVADLDGFVYGKILPEVQGLLGAITDSKRDVQTAPSTPGASADASPPAMPSATVTPTVSASPTESPTPSSSP